MLYKYENKFHNTQCRSSLSEEEFEEANIIKNSIRRKDRSKNQARKVRLYNKIFRKLCGMKECKCSVTFSQEQEQQENTVKETNIKAAAVKSSKKGNNKETKVSKENVKGNASKKAEPKKKTNNKKPIAKKECAECSKA
jgi:hypothetical protein